MPTVSALSFPVSERDTVLSCCSSGRACACVHKMLLMTALQRLAILTQSYLHRARRDCTSHSASQTLPLLLLQQWETHVPMLTLWARCILSRAEASKATGSAPWRRLGAKSFRQESHLDDSFSSAFCSGAATFGWQLITTPGSDLDNFHALQRVLLIIRARWMVDMGEDPEQDSSFLLLSCSGCICKSPCRPSHCPTELRVSRRRKDYSLAF